MRNLDRRGQVGVALLLVVIVVGAALQGRGDAEPPSASESQRLGWHDPVSSDHLARDILERVNEERVARGAGRLAWDEGLAEKARDWSVEMIASGEFEHSTDEYRAQPGFVGTGENIAIDHPSTAEAHVSLMRSEGHRHNLLEPGYDALGVGVVCRRDGVMWVTQIFGVEQARPPRPAVDLVEEPIVRDDRGVTCP